MLAVLDILFLQPLMAIYGAVYSLLPGSLGVGGRLIAFGILLNLFLIPAYRQMERRSRGFRELKQRVAREVARMKRHFSGRERYFYIRAVYRQHRYKPVAELLGSADLALQIIMFATVYRFISGLPELHGASFGPIADLGAPDTLLGGIHLLPLLMTAINIGATFAYSPERGRRLQGCALAVLFLVLLYNSPAGLVLYWTANNLFSLARNLARPLLSRGAGVLDAPSLREVLTQK